MAYSQPYPQQPYQPQGYVSNQNISYFYFLAIIHTNNNNLVLTLLQIKVSIVLLVEVTNKYKVAQPTMMLKVEHQNVKWGKLLYPYLALQFM